MKKLSGLIIGLSLAVAAPIASAQPDALYLMPQVGGAESTFNMMSDNSEIHSATAGNEFWYAGTGGVPSN